MSLPGRRLLATVVIVCLGYLSFVAGCAGLNLLAMLAGGR